MKISELVPEIIGEKCTYKNNKKIYIIMDYIKNINEKNNVKIYDPISLEIEWVPFNLIDLLDKKTETGD